MDEAIVRSATLWSSSSELVAGASLFLSSPWMLILAALPLLIVLLRKKRWIAIASIALSMAASDAINARIVKPLVARERPCRAISDLPPVAKCGVGKSFASGHAAVATAFAVTATPAVPYGWAVFVPPAILVAASRVMLGQHYPSDLFGGVLLGGVIGGAFELLRRRLERRLRAPSPCPRDLPATSPPASPPP